MLKIDNVSGAPGLVAIYSTISPPADACYGVTYLRSHMNPTYDTYVNLLSFCCHHFSPHLSSFRYIL